jgi:hypothetical protein
MKRTRVLVLGAGFGGLRLQRRALELGSPALDQRRQLARGGLVREGIAPLIGPLSEQGEVVVLADQIRESRGPAGQASETLACASKRKCSPSTCAADPRAWLWVG